MYVRPKAVKVVSTRADFLGLLAQPTQRPKTIIVRNDIDLSVILPPSLYPCHIIGETSDNNSIPKITGMILDFPYQGAYTVENIQLGITDITLAKGNQVSLKHCSIINPDTVRVYDGGGQEGIFIVEGLKINQDNVNGGTPLWLQGGLFDITGVEITRDDFAGGNEDECILIERYAVGIIRDVICTQDPYSTTDAYLINLDADLNVQGHKIAENIIAEVSRSVLRMFSKDIHKVRCEHVMLGNALSANGLKIQDADAYKVMLHESPSGAGAIDLSDQGRLFDSYITSEGSNGAIEAGINCSIARCVIDVPTAGRLGAKVVDDGSSPQGYFNWNKGFGNGNHLEVVATVPDYTARFNSDCVFVNPKASFSNNA